MFFLFNSGKVWFYAWHNNIIIWKMVKILNFWGFWPFFQKGFIMTPWNLLLMHIGVVTGVRKEWSQGHILGHFWTPNRTIIRLKASFSSILQKIYTEFTWKLFFKLTGTTLRSVQNMAPEVPWSQDKGPKWQQICLLHILESNFHDSKAIPNPFGPRCTLAIRGRDGWWVVMVWGTKVPKSSLWCDMCRRLQGWFLHLWYTRDTRCWNTENWEKNKINKLNQEVCKCLGLLISRKELFYHNK